MIQDTLREDMIELYKKTFDYKFQKKTYESDINELKDTYAHVLRAAAAACEGTDEELAEAASFVPEYVAGELAAITGKR